LPAATGGGAGFAASASKNFTRSCRYSSGGTRDSASFARASASAGRPCRRRISAAVSVNSVLRGSTACARVIAAHASSSIAPRRASCHAIALSAGAESALSASAAFTSPRARASSRVARAASPDLRYHAA
jgi:hypothetical protein